MFVGEGKGGKREVGDEMKEKEEKGEGEKGMEGGGGRRGEAFAEDRGKTAVFGDHRRRSPTGESQKRAKPRQKVGANTVT